MKSSKILIAVIVLVLGGYIVNKYVLNDASSTSAPWFKALDKNKDGKLSSDELKALDKDGDGTISKEEADAYQIPPEELKKWDKNGDGSISQDELRSWGG